jgi:diacylglycerol kinase family enzyme
MKVVHPASTALLITSLLLVHTQTILVVADDGDKILLLAGGDGILNVGGDGSLDAQDGGAICCLPGGGANLNSCTSGPTL